MKTYNAVNFLLFSYLGITLDSYEKTVVNGAINRAYRDVCYEEEHKSTCDALVKLYEGKTKEGYEFTYGIAQKWVNMTTKYICLIYSIYEEYGNRVPDNHTIHKFLKQYEQFQKTREAALDIPIDRMMEKCILDSIDSKSINPEINEMCKKPWSKWQDYNKYRTLQKNVKKDIVTIGNGETVIDWETKNG